MNAAVITPAKPSPIDAATLRRRISELPAMPQVVLEVLTLLRQESAGAEECATAIASDPTLTALTLRLANSAFYGVPGRVGSIRDAIQMLGRRTLGALLTTAVVSTRFKPTACEGFDFAAFWRHALATAIAAQSLARELTLDDEAAFTAGLLHDIGRLALAAHWPQPLSAALAQSRRDDAPLAAVETALLGTSHSEVGALIADHWRFPAAVAQAIAYHHAPPAAARASVSDLVHVADALAHALDLHHDPDEMVPEIEPASWERLALAPAQCLRAFERTETGVAALCQALGVPA